MQPSPTLFEWAAQQSGVEMPAEVMVRPPTRWEEFYTGKWIDALVWALTGPVTIAPALTGVARQHRHDIVLERLIRLLQLGRRQREHFDAAPPEALDDLYRELGHEWTQLVDRWTNWEVCLILCEASFKAPLGRDAAEEYKRAFAHCFTLGEYRRVWSLGNERAEPIDAEVCRQFRWEYRGKWPLVDEAELAWIAGFNAALQDPDADEGLSRW